VAPALFQASLFHAVDEYVCVLAIEGCVGVSVKPLHQCGYRWGPSQRHLHVVCLMAIMPVPWTCGLPVWLKLLSLNGCSSTPPASMAMSAAWFS
jgi:hypothetical protein